MKKKVKRYNEGGKTEEQYKKEGLEASKGDKVGFFERLRMGNIDAPGSEAYQRFGAGRGRMEEESKKPVSESAKETSDYSGRGAKSYGDDGMDVPHSGTPTGKRDSSVEDSSTSVSKGVMSNYMPSGVYKQPEPRAGETKIDKIRVPAIKKPAKKQTSINIPTGMAGSDTRRTTGLGMAGSDTKPKPKTSKSTRTSAEIRSGKPAAEEKPSKVPKLSFLTPERLESSRKSYYSGFESKPVRSTADIRAGRGMKSGGKVSSASSRADGCAQRGKTRGKLF